MSLATIRCPVCETVAEPAAQVENIVICGTCGASGRVSTTGFVVRAVFQDTINLTPAHQAVLKRARGRIVRAGAGR